MRDGVFFLRTYLYIYMRFLKLIQLNIRATKNAFKIEHLKFYWFHAMAKFFI
jgi:hypothetical protein